MSQRWIHLGEDRVAGRRPTRGKRPSAHALETLHRSVGNRAVAQLLGNTSRTPTIQREAAYLSRADGRYHKLADDTAALGPGKLFTDATRERVLTTNHAIATLMNRFALMQAAIDLAGVSELSGMPVAPLREFKADVSEIDHIYPKEKGGANSIRNAQVLAGDENSRKSKTYPWGPQPGYSGSRLMVTAQVQKYPAIHVGDVFPINGAGSGATVDLSGRLGLPGAAIPIATARAEGLAPVQDPL